MGKNVENLSSAAVVIGALRVNYFLVSGDLLSTVMSAVNLCKLFEHLIVIVFKNFFKKSLF